MNKDSPIEKTMIRELSSGKWPRLLDGSGHKRQVFSTVFLGLRFTGR